MPKVYQHAAARRDLVEHFIYLAESAGLEIAEQFLTDAEASFNALAERPMIGTPLCCGIPIWPGYASGASIISTTV